LLLLLAQSGIDVEANQLCGPETLALPDSLQAVDLLSRQPDCSAFQHVDEYTLPPYVCQEGNFSSICDVDLMCRRAAIEAAIQQPEYQKNEFGNGFGVVSFVGEDQALEVVRFHEQHLAPDV
jgi:hypothetical protein